MHIEALCLLFTFYFYLFSLAFLRLSLPPMSITVNNISKLYGSQKALDNISFSINTGEVVGFLGPNGAGKSTMMKIITGFIPATKGNVLVNGLDVTEHPIAIKKNIGYLPENNPLYPDMYVREYLRFIAGIYKIGKSTKHRIEEIIGLCGLDSEQHKKIGQLSKGYRQRVGLAQALIHDPEILILDEPTSGLDPNQIVEIRKLILEAGQKKTVMLSTHIMQEVEAMAGRVIIIDKGIIKADDTKDKIYSSLDNNNNTIMVEFDREINKELLASVAGVAEIRSLDSNKWIIQSKDSSDIRPAVFRFAVNNELTVLSMQQQEQSLEAIFRQLTS